MEAKTSVATKRASAAAPKAEKTDSRSAGPKLVRQGRPAGRKPQSSPVLAPPTARARTSQRRSRAAANAPKDALIRHKIPIEDVALHAVERPASGWRASSERAIILIHGAGVDHRDWTFSFLSRIAPSWRVIAFDRPGFGHSTRSPGAASALPANQARLLRKAAAELQVEEAVLVGHSWGGAVAMAWGIEAPDQTIGVASLAGAIAPWSLGKAIENGKRFQMAAMTAMGEGGMHAAALDTLTESFSPNAMPTGYARHLGDALSSQASATMADTATINGALALMCPNYPNFARPVELVYGDADIILDHAEQGERAAGMLPCARLTVLKGAGHMLHQTHARDCLAAIERLFKKPAAGRKSRSGSKNPA